jgi:MFS family permease
MTPSEDERLIGIDGPPAIAAAMWIGTGALMVLGIQPILLAALVAEHRISDAALGRLATTEVLALALGAALGAALFRTGGMRAKALVLGGLLTAANLASCWVAGGLALFLLRFAAGALEGIVLGCAIVILTRTRHPDRINGVFLAAQTIPQAIAAFLLPIYLVPRWGSDAAFVILALLTFIGMLVTPLLPNRGTSAPRTPAGRWTWNAEVACLLGAIALAAAGTGAALEYLAHLAALHGFSAHVVGLATSGNLVLQVIGAFIVVGVAYRLPATVALLGGIALQGAIAAAFPAAPSGALFVALACGFGLFMLALGPFQVAWLVRIEPTRRVALVILPVTLIGWSLGPFTASFFVSEGNVDPAFWVSACLFICAITCLITALVMGSRRTASPAQVPL